MRTASVASDRSRSCRRCDRPRGRWRRRRPRRRTRRSRPIRNSAATRRAVTPEREAEALAFVREHHPELATVLEALKPRNPAEYRKAIGELSQVARTLAEVKARNPRRYELALDAWKAKSRVELLAAQLAGLADARNSGASSGRRSRPRSTPRSAASSSTWSRPRPPPGRLRESLDRLENHRDAVVEARFRALQPKKAQGRARRPARPGPPPVDRPSTASQTGENRP